MAEWAMLCVLTPLSWYNQYSKHITHSYMSAQYYQLKHGFHAVLAEWQLARLRPVFRLERLAISPTSFSTPPFLSINWETVAHHNLTQVNIVHR